MILLSCAIVSHSVSTHTYIFFWLLLVKSQPSLSSMASHPSMMKIQTLLGIPLPSPPITTLTSLYPPEHWTICSSLLHDTLQTSETFPGVCPQSELPPLNLPRWKLLYNFYISGQHLLLREVFPDCAGRFFFFSSVPAALKTGFH